MATGPFGVGDVVRLKSGGPAMTIDSFDEDGDAVCVWFDSDMKHQSRVFTIGTLEKSAKM
jgi:uncharacterized protein YodC (DUF2158 family)